MPQNTDKITNVIVAQEAVGDIIYPHCELPPHFYERALYLQRKKQDAVPVVTPSKRPLLTIQTWDGRDVVSFVTDW